MACDYIKVLNLAQQGQWDEAHQLVQTCSDQWSCLIHAYLHRVEGDSANALYWYQRANSKMPDDSVEDELNRLFLLVEGNKH